MQMHADDTGMNDLSECVIGYAFTVLNTLGAGFAEKVYENALAIEICAAGFTVMRQCGVRVHYSGELAAEYFPDLLMEDVLLFELKTMRALGDAHFPRGA